MNPGEIYCERETKMTKREHWQIRVQEPPTEGETYRLHLVPPASEQEDGSWLLRRCADPDNIQTKPPPEPMVQMTLEVADVSVSIWGTSIARAVTLVSQAESALAPRVLRTLDERHEQQKKQAAASPLPSAQDMDERRQQRRHDQQLDQCPTHGKSRRSAKSGGLFCPAKLQDGTYCKWTNEQAA